ncbi:MAG: oligopeptide:H+ symporter, partial [Mycetocola sp.]
MSQATQPSLAREDHSFFGQPRSLASIFGVEMWERFSFYGMQGILLLYLYYSAAEGGLGIPQSTAAGIVGAYGGSVYLSTILGAWVADRILGSERVLFYSAIVIMCGHIALALIPGVPGVATGLILVAVGSGGLKANATSVVGTLYAEEDPRRDAGFSIFYLGINLGAFLGPILTGLLQQSLGFHFGFALAAIGMAIGLTQYSFGRKRLPDVARRVPDPLPRSRWPLFGAIGALVVVVIVVLVAVGVITADNLVIIVIGVTIVAAVAYFVVILSSSQVTTVERRRVFAFIPLFIASAAFWSLYQQQFTVVTIYSDERLDRNLLGWEMPVSWVQSINPIFIILLSGVFAALWTKWGAKQPSTPLKFAAGTTIMGIGFLLFLPFAGGGTHSTPLLAMIGILLVFTIAELLLSPVGLSVSTKLAPQAFTTQMVALFFLSVALGTAVSGRLAEWYLTVPETLYFGVL